MIERRIASEAYWRQDFAVSDQDLEELGLLLMEAERPMAAEELAQALISSRCQRVEGLIHRQLSRGQVYRPNGAYQVGEQVVFAQNGFILGTVIEQREGRNPEHGDFSVISVQLETEPEGSLRYYAAELDTPHRLSAPDSASVADAYIVSPASVVERHGDHVADVLVARLKAASGFASFREEWVAAGTQADVHIGHLNIAEAVVDLQGEPVSPDQLLADLDLPDEVPFPLKVFSINSALVRDDRFDDVGDKAQVRWSLRRWEPELVLAPPAWLKYEAVAYDRTSLDVAHLQIEREVDDELSGLIASQTALGADSLTLVLSYPHWRGGTLPLTDRTSGFFPAGFVDQHTQITFVDRANRKESSGWVVRGGKYVYGLDEWYGSNNVPVGAFLKLQQLDDPSRVAVDFVPRRMQRDWVRVAYREGDGQLAFQMQKRPIACEYDELYLVDELDRKTADSLREQERELDRALKDTVQDVFKALAKTDANGMVHSKTLYNAVNVVRRSPPGLIFSVLFEVPEFVTAGDGYWMFQGGAAVL